MSSNTRILPAGIVAGALLAATPALAVEINTIDPAFTAPMSWYQFDTRPGGSATIVDLTAQGGNLENNQPLPTGAARLETDATNAAKAEIAVSDAYGIVSDILSSFELSYSYYKASGGAPAPAPSIKLTFFNEPYNDVDGQDGFGTLVYEPYLNGANPPEDTWTDVAIDYDEGLFWWTGGFGQPSGGGGCPCLTLEDWDNTLDSGFDTADLVAVSVGLGSFNPAQIGFFDNVRIAYGNGDYDVTYDFEADAPEPTTLALLGAGLAGLGLMRRRRAAAGTARS